MVVAQMSVKKMFVLQDWFHAVDNVVTQSRYLSKVWQICFMVEDGVTI
jgi:hypothetical protein